MSIRKRYRLANETEAVLSRCHFPELEASLVEWLTGLCRDGITMSGECIKMQGKKLSMDLYPDVNLVNFKASDGWLQKFTIRHHITFRCVTSKGEKSLRME